MSIDDCYYIPEFLPFSQWGKEERRNEKAGNPSHRQANADDWMTPGRWLRARREAEHMDRASLAANMADTGITVEQIRAVEMGELGGSVNLAPYEYMVEFWHIFDSENGICGKPTKGLKRKKPAAPKADPDPEPVGELPLQFIPILKRGKKRNPDNAPFILIGLGLHKVTILPKPTSTKRTIWRREGETVWKTVLSHMGEISLEADQVLYVRAGSDFYTYRVDWAACIKAYC